MAHLTYDNDRIKVTGNLKELNSIKEKFPGTLKNGLDFFIPEDSRILWNIYQRLKENYSVTVDSKVASILNAPMVLKKIPASFKFFTAPKEFQEIALRYAYTVGGGGLLLEPGMGKTKIVLDFIALMGFKKSVIVCPKPLLFVWQDERAVHRPDKSIYVVNTIDWETEKEGIMNHDIVVINYSKAVLMAADLWSVKFDFIGVDEALIKDPRSQRTEILTWLRKEIPHRMLMSGTLVNNTPLDIFAPVRFLAPALVGTSFSIFKDTYAVQVKVNKHDPTSHKIVVGYRKVEQVKSILESVSIVMTKDEWLKLPPKTFREIVVQPSDHQRNVYQDLQANYVAEVDGQYVEVDSPLTVLTKLIQVSNGFVYISKESDVDELEDTIKKRKKKRETYFFETQPKIDKLIELLKGEFSNRRVMVWFNLTAEYELIAARLDKEGITHIDIRGGEKDVGSKVRRFNSDISQRVLLCQAKSVNYGITVLGKDYDEEDAESFPTITPEVYTQIFMSLNFSLEVYLQQQDRIHRLGQEHECEYILIMCNTDAERRIFNAIKEKMSIRGQVLQDVITSLGILLKDSE